MLGVSAAGAIVWRSNVQRSERQAFASSAAHVTAALGTTLHRDTDFVTTLRGLMTMRPHLSASAFNAWYAALDGPGRQVSGVGTAVIQRVPAAALEEFQARRDRDPAFVRMVGVADTIPKKGSGPYCLLAAGTATVQIDASATHLVEGNYCDSRSPIGRSEAAILLASTDSNTYSADSAVAFGIPTLVIEAPFYRRGAPLETVGQREAASLGWVMTTFEPRLMLGSALGDDPRLNVSLYHRQPGADWVLAADAGRRVPASAPTRTTVLPVEGDWLVKVQRTAAYAGSPIDVEAAVMFAGGALSALLLFLLLVVLIRSRNNALGMVEETTGQLRHQAMHDALTGLPNRVLALDRAEQMLARARRGRLLPIAALLIDVDGFKLINDTFDHRAGDACLRILAERLRQLVREGDTVARISADEFVVLLDESTFSVAPEIVAERLLEVAREPFHADVQGGRPLSLTVSVGVAYGLRETAEALLAYADVSLHVAKTTGKNRFVVYESGMESAAKDRLKLEMDLAEALEKEELFLVYQPIFDLSTERIIGTEALLRWRHPIRGVVSPDVFIPIAEESGLILAIGRWVLEQACRQGAEWRRQGHDISTAVNVSAVQLEDDCLMDEVHLALARSGLKPTMLTLEITETTVMRDPDATAKRLTALGRLGVRIAIDDFGTGYSSLAYLRQFPVDSLKIDRSFVNGLTTSARSAALIHTLAGLGKALKLQTLAEGIETIAQLRALQNEGCDHGQGYLFSKPLVVEELGRFLDAQGSQTLVS